MPVDAFFATLERLAERALEHEWVWRLLIGIAIALLGLWIARWLARALDRLMHRFDVDPILRNFLRNLGYVLAVVVVLIVALDFAGVPTSSLLAVLGAAGLAIGLGLKDSLSNIASGVVLIMLRPFHVGDRVQIAGLEGLIDSVRIFQTRLHTADNREIMVPNSQITSAPIVNYTAMGQRRIDVPVGISYDVDIDLPRQRLLAIAASNPAILTAPAPKVIVAEFAESSVVLQLQVWAAAVIHSELRAWLLERILEDFRRNSIRIPGPQREIHLVQTASSPPSRPADP
jgi:small-conductance mechanosensitive channel